MAAAVLVLIGAVAAAAWLFVATPEARSGPSVEEISASGGHQFYGGDAYTGIQNAAADTESAVVAGSNAMTDLMGDVYDRTAETEAEHWNHLYRGLAALILLLGVANFGRALHRTTG